MIEARFSAFFRSPVGILLCIGVIILTGIAVLLFVANVFSSLLTYTPLPVE